MKECPSCKTKNRNDAAFCAQCGANLEAVGAKNDEWTAAAGDLLDKAKEAAAVGAKLAKEAAVTGAQRAQKAMEEAEVKATEKKRQKTAAGGWDSAAEVSLSSAGNTASSGSSMLVDQSETITATIGSNYLQNYLSGGSVSRGIGILTQKRFYYKGKNFSGTGKAVKSTTTEGVVSLEDIAFTEFTHTRHIGFLAFAILLTVAAIIAAATIEDAVAVVTLIVAALPFYILFFVKRQTLFLVSFPGGGFAFDIRWYPIADIRDFQRQLHLLKDHIKEEKRA